MMILCDYMKWTYNEYMDNPEWFNDLILEKIRLDNAYGNRKAADSNNHQRNRY